MSKEDLDIKKAFCPRCISQGHREKVYFKFDHLQDGPKGIVFAMYTCTRCYATYSRQSLANVNKDVKIHALA